MSSHLVARLGDRSAFSRLGAIAYLNHAGISPASDPVQAAVGRALVEQAEQGSVAFGARMAEREALRAKLATLLHADSDELALVPNTMYGLSAIAVSLPWRRGARVIVFDGEYPTNVSVWQSACERFGVSITHLPLGDFSRPEGPDFSRLEAELAKGAVQLCAASAVQFQTGLRMPLQRIAELCHAHGAELAIDAVQALGAMPIDVRALGVDYLAAGSHKWLLGLDGAGVLFARRELAARLRPGIVGAMSHVDATAIFVNPNALRYDRPLRSDVRVFEGGMMSSLSLAALSASLDLLLPLGAANIHAHVNAYLDRLEPGLTARGFGSLRLADSARRSCILGVRPPPGVDAAALCAKLAIQGVITASPDGVLRFAPHFYCAFDEVPKVLAALDVALG